MSRSHLTIPLLALVLLVNSCLSPRKAKERDCRKGEKLMAEAVMKCPELLITEVQHDTIVLYTAPKASAGERSYSQAQMDSLATLCSNIVAAYRAHADRAEQMDSTHVAQLMHKLREKVCAFPPITEANDQLLLKIWAENGKVRYWYNVLPQKSTVVVNTPTRTIGTQAPCPPVGVSAWYRTGFWILLVILVLLFAGAYILSQAPMGP